MLVPPTEKRGSQTQNLKRLIYWKNNERWVGCMGMREFSTTMGLYQIGYEGYLV